MSTDSVFAVSMIANAEVLDFLAQRLFDKQQAIHQWFFSQWQQTPPPLYGSVDIRNAGFKVAPVDMNLFPAGFNNLNIQFLDDAVMSAKRTIEEFYPGAKHIAIIPENHTRNLYYWENIYALMHILKRAGFNVIVGSLMATGQQTITTENSQSVTIYPLARKNDRLMVNNIFPDFILLNNDLSDGLPAILTKLEQPIFPPAELGWHQRLKSEHFQHYAAISQEFSDLLEIDSWLITPFFRHCGEIDFLQREGMDCLIENTEILLNNIAKKYQEYRIQQQPFVIVKADAGTQGMAVMTVRHAEDLRLLNRKQRSSMAKSKGGIPVHRVLVQEGVYTFEVVGPHSYVAEPVIYLWGKCVIGGFYRIHQKRGADEKS